MGPVARQILHVVMTGDDHTLDAVRGEDLQDSPLPSASFLRIEFRMGLGLRR